MGVHGREILRAASAVTGSFRNVSPLSTHTMMHGPEARFDDHDRYQSDTLKTWDAITAGAKAAGHEIAVFGEVHRYHFSEHDANAPKPSSVGNKNASSQVPCSARAPACLAHSLLSHSVPTLSPE